MNADQMKEFVELCRHPAIAERSVGWEGERKYAYFCGDDIRFSSIHLSGNSDSISAYGGVWLPPVFDYQHPERGLWGMVDWLNWDLETLFSVEIAPVLIDTRQVPNIPLPEAMPLPIALAKAIIWQHERAKP